MLAAEAVPRCAVQVLHAGFAFQMRICLQHLHLLNAVTAGWIS
jgi:hypothetical protein